MLIINTYERKWTMMFNERKCKVAWFCGEGSQKQYVGSSAWIYIYVYFGMEMNREGILMKKQEMRMLSNMIIKGNNGVVNKYNVSRRIWKGEAPPYCLVWVRANSIQKRGRSQLEKVRNLILIGGEEESLEAQG